MKITKKRRGYSRSRSDSGVSCDSSKSTAHLEKSVKLSLQIHESNIKHVENVESEGESQKLEDARISTEGKLSFDNISTEYAPSKVGKQELFLSNLNIGTIASVESLTMNSRAKKTNRTRKSPPDKLSKVSAAMKKKSESLRFNKCKIEDVDEWNKLMFGNVRSPRKKTSKDCNAQLVKDMQQTNRAGTETDIDNVTKKRSSCNKSDHSPTVTGSPRTKKVKVEDNHIEKHKTETKMSCTSSSVKRCIEKVFSDSLITDLKISEAGQFNTVSDNISHSTQNNEEGSIENRSELEKSNKIASNILQNLQDDTLPNETNSSNHTGSSPSDELSDANVEHSECGKSKLFAINQNKTNDPKSRKKLGMTNRNSKTRFKKRSKKRQNAKYVAENTQINEISTSSKQDSPKRMEIKTNNLNYLKTCSSDSNNENLIVRAQKNKFTEKHAKTNLETEQNVMNAKLIDTRPENTTGTENKLDLFHKDEELRKKYSATLNLSVRVERIKLFTNEWYRKEPKSLPSTDNTLDSEKSSVESNSPFSIVKDFRKKGIINLDREWDLCTVKNRPKPYFKFKFTNDFVSITSRNDIFLETQLAEGLKDSTTQSLGNITTNDTFTDTIRICNENLSADDNVIAPKEKTCEIFQSEEPEKLDKNKSPKSNKNQVSNNSRSDIQKSEIPIKSPGSLNSQYTKKLVIKDSIVKSNKIGKKKSPVKLIQTDGDSKRNEKLLKTNIKVNVDTKDHNVQNDKNKRSDKKHHHVEDKIKSSKITEKSNKDRKHVKSTAGSSQAISEQLLNKNIINEKNDPLNTEHKNIDVTLANKELQIEEKLIDKINSEKMCTAPKNTTQDVSPCDSNSASNHVLQKPKHIFKFVDIESSEFKRPPTRMNRKVILNRPLLDDDAFKVPLSPKIQPLKSDVAFPQKLVQDSNQTATSELSNLSPKKPEREFDIISIYAETIGVESVADAASVRNDFDSDMDFCDDDEPDQHTNLNDWVENTYKINETQKIFNPVELPTPEEIVPNELSEEHTFEEKVQSRTISRPLITSEEIHLEQQNKEGSSVDTRVSLNSCNKYQGVDVFKYMCKSVKCFGECYRKLHCQFKHEFPPEWKVELKCLSLESILELYNHIKEKKFVFLFRQIFSTITEYLGDKRDFNNLLSMVKDVLEINMNSDRAPFINDIINALCKTGVTYQSIVEVVYKNTNVNENLINLLSDILLNLTVDKGNSNANWPIIKELIQNRNYDIDNGIIQIIVMQSLETDSTKNELLIKVYHDLIKKIPNHKLNSIFESLLNNFYNRLLMYNLNTEASEFITRCQSLNITLGNKSDHSNSPASSSVSSIKNISKVPPFTNTQNRELKHRNVSPGNVNFVAPTNFLHPTPHLLQSGEENPGPRPLSNSFPQLNYMPLNYQIPRFPHETFSKSRSPNSAKKPVVVHKTPWSQVRNRRKPVLYPDPFPSSSSGAPYTPNSSKLQTSNIYFNKEEIVDAICVEDKAMILSLIMKYKDNQFTDRFIKTSIETMLETKPNFPTFFSSLCQNVKHLNADPKTLYILKAIGLNLILHLSELSSWDQACKVYKVLKIRIDDDLINVKSYLPEKYTYFKRVLIISLIHIKTCQFDIAWNMLKENTFGNDHIWQEENIETEISYRNDVIDELLTSVTKNDSWVIGLNIVQFLLKQKIVGVDVSKHINGILLHAINAKCKVNQIMEFVNSSQTWYNYISKHIFRAIVSYLVSLGCWSLAKTLYALGCNFDVYPPLIGNEQLITLKVYYVLEEIWLMFEIFFDKMIRFKPIHYNIAIQVLEDTQVIPTELPKILKQYSITPTTMQVRIIRVLNNHLVPAIIIHNNHNDVLMISSEAVNKHIDGRLVRDG